MSRRRAHGWGRAFGWWLVATVLFILIFAVMKLLLALALQEPWYTGYEYPAAIPTHLAASMLLGWVHWKNISAVKEEAHERP